MVSEAVIRLDSNCRATASVAKYWTRQNRKAPEHRRTPKDPVILLPANHFPQCSDQFLVFFHCAHGNADPFRQAIPFERAHDDFPLQQLLEHCTTVADVYHHEICSGWYERNLHVSKFFLQEKATFVYDPLGFAQVRFILERCDGAGLCNAVHVEWLPCLVKHFGHSRRRDGIPDADPGKAVNLRERTEDNHISPVASKSKCVGRII